MRGTTAVRKGYDFTFNHSRYPVKANRPSGKPGSFITLTPKAKNYDWDFLVWLLYGPRDEVHEAWLGDVSAYKLAFESLKRLSPSHYRQGRRLV